MKLKQLVQDIKEVMPPETLFTEKDAAVFQENKELLLALAEPMVKEFYRILLNHAATGQIFLGDDKEKRKADFLGWWQHSVTGPFDDEYWIWQAFVGVIHVKRGVKNAMMMSMWGWVLDYVTTDISTKVEPQTAYAIIKSLGRLSATAQALAADSFMATYINGVVRSTGFTPKLIARMVDNEIEELVHESRQVEQHV